MVAQARTQQNMITKNEANQNMFQINVPEILWKIIQDIPENPYTKFIQNH